jgi:hypothetical protein
MALIRTVVTIPSVSGVPADAFVNTWHTRPQNPPDNAMYANIEGRIMAFYTDQQPGQVAGLASYFSKEAARITGGVSLKSYLLPGVPGDVGSPDHMSNYTLTDVGGGQELPAEVACCLSYHGNLVDIPNRAGADTPIATPDAAVDMGAPATHPGRIRLAERHRGRLFLGPLNTTACQVGPGGAGRQRPGAVFLNDVKLAAAGVNADLTSLGAEWIVFSRRDWAGYPVVGGFIDDAFDTQRRRGAKAATRVTF